MINAYLTDTITLNMHKGADKYQRPYPTEDVSVKCFKEYKERHIVNQAGTLVVSNMQLLMNIRTIIFDGFTTRATNTISYLDKVTIDGRSYSITLMEKPRDFSERFLKVFIV